MKMQLSNRHLSALEQISKAAERRNSFYHRGSFAAVRGRVDIWDPWCNELNKSKPTVLRLCLEICVKGTEPEVIAAQLRQPMSVVVAALAIGLEEWAKLVDRVAREENAA